jgi:hypothetical protein
VSNHGFVFSELIPLISDGPPAARAGSGEILRELGSLGLSREASLGVLRILLATGARRAASDPSDW